jgi:hypothetical protein
VRAPVLRRCAVLCRALHLRVRLSLCFNASIKRLRAGFVSGKLLIASLFERQ